MGRLIDADEATHNELKKLSERIIKNTIKIEPHILEPDEIIKGKPYCLLGAKIVCGTDEPYEYTWITHHGERIGPDWERSKLVWLHVYSSTLSI